ncbi:hypothetical protein [Streptomyces alkaliphilus]|uniref:hypothetical protein n=1 Tax=Streptomyces alkaliphilus TaxID=1472722 RepID=UPI001295CEFE|nr:hypothetical protein [Streptomyces alkaliphilus]
MAGHGPHGFWTPTSLAAYPATTDLITTARRDILAPITRAITTVQATIHAIEVEHRDGA